jgi:hypothetical protein
MYISSDLSWEAGEQGTHIAKGIIAMQVTEKRLVAKVYRSLSSERL